jgi:hypothetical protein
MLASRPVRIALVAVGVWLICAVIVVWQHLRPDPEALLGITLPSSVENMQVAVNYRFIGDYRAYLRFELNEQDLPALLADPAFQGIEQSCEDRPDIVGDDRATGTAHLVEPAPWQEIYADLPLLPRPQRALHRPRRSMVCDRQNRWRAGDGICICVGSVGRLISTRICEYGVALGGVAANSHTVLF